MNSANHILKKMRSRAHMLSLKDGVAKAGVVALVLGAVVAGSAVAIAQEEQSTPAPTPSPVVPGQPIVLTPPELNVVAQPETVQALPSAIEPVPAPPATTEPSVSSVLPATAEPVAMPATVPATPTPTPASPATPAASVSDTSPLSALPEAVVAAPSAEQPSSVPAVEEAPAAAAPKEEPKPVDPPAELPAEPPVDPRVKADEVINSLRQGTFTKPLSLTDMAAINDAIQRMNYLSDIEQKMAELNPNMAGAGPAQIAAPITAGGAGVPVATAGVVSAVASPTSSARGTVTVLQISGSQGKFKALVSTQDGRTMYVRVGDSLADGQVVGIDLSGVRVRGSYGLDILPFRSQAPVLIGQ